MHARRSSALGALPTVGPRLTIVILIMVLSPFDAHAQGGSSSSASCERLASSTLLNTTITSAASVPAGSFTPPQPAGSAPAAAFSDLPAFCRVVASTRMLNSDVKFEVWMPAQGWTGNFLPAGSSFWGGPIPFARMREVLKTGAVTVGTNLGIEGFNGPSFVMEHPEKLENLKMVFRCTRSSNERRR